MPDDQGRSLSAEAQKAWPREHFFGGPQYRNLPAPDPADYPRIDDFEVIPVATPQGLQMRWQRSTGELVMLFPWYDVAGDEPGLGRDHPPIGPMAAPWLHIHQGWYFSAIEDQGEVIVETGDDISNVTLR